MEAQEAQAVFLEVTTTNDTLLPAVKEIMQNNTESQVTEPDYEGSRLAINYARFILLAFIIFTGLVLNTLAIVCFITSYKLKRTTTGYYLIALTSADIVYLLGDLLRWMNTLISDEPLIGLTFRDDSNFWCKIIYFLRYYGKLASAWITVAITVERYISVSFPMKASQISTKRNAYIVIAGIYVICAALTLFPLWTIGLIEYGEGSDAITYCSYLDQDEYNEWNWVINRAGSLFVPSVILFVLTALIVFNLYQIGKRRKSLMGTGLSNLETQLTLMLIAVAVAFFLMRLPYTISYYLYDFRESIWASPISKAFKHRLWTAMKLTDILATANYAINFFLYCLAGGAFRGQFLALMRCETKELKRKKTISAASTLSTSVRTLHKISPACSKLTINTHNSEGQRVSPASSNSQINTNGIDGQQISPASSNLKIDIENSGEDIEV